MPYQHFTSQSRDRLQQMLSNQTEISQIAEQLGKHISSIKREILRNQSEGGYISRIADVKACSRRADSKVCPKKTISN